MFHVTFVTRKPLSTAFEFDGDDVDVTMVVQTSGLIINVRSIYLYVVNNHKVNLSFLSFTRLLDFDSQAGRIVHQCHSALCLILRDNEFSDVVRHFTDLILNAQVVQVKKRI